MEEKTAIPENGTVLAPSPQEPPNPSEANALPESSDSTVERRSLQGKKEDEDDKDSRPITGFKLAAVIMSVTFVGTLVMLDTAIIVTAIPHITTQFHSLGDVGWYGSAYLLAACSLQPLTGKLYTLFNSKWIFLAFFGVFELGSLLCAVATSSNMLIVGRAVAGSGSSGLLNGTLTIIATCVPLEKRPVYLGLMRSVSQIGTVLGPLLGGVLTDRLSWRWCFYINLPAGAVVGVLLLCISIPDRRSNKAGAKATLRTIVEKLDLLGFAIFAPAAIQFLLALEWGGTSYPWDSATVIGLFCGAAGMFCLFLEVEYRKGDAAMIPLHMVRQRIVWCSNLVMFFSFTSVVSYYLPIYFQTARNATPTMSGVYLLPTILSQIMSAITAGYLVSKLGYYLPWSIASGILTAIGMGLLSTLTPTSSAGTWIGFQIIIGAGRGCGSQMPILALQKTLPRDQMSVGMSFAVFSQTLGSALLLSFAQTIFSNGLVSALPIFAPGVDPQTVITAGASGVREAVSRSALPGVLDAYSKAISETFYLGAGAAVATFVFGCGIGWKSVKKPKAVEPKA